MKKLMIGNAAIARGAYEAGLTVASAYPGTPSTEITENLAKYPEIYCEWAPNEKVAAEVAIGASIGGARSMVCFKHVGMNVAADPLFTFAYTGVNGGMVIVVADDPGMHSSQNEQDSRYYAKSAHIPMLEPSDSSEAKEFTKLAFDLSEKYDTPVFIRMTTRVAHSQSLVNVGERVEKDVGKYAKTADKYVMVPAFAIKRHLAVEDREQRFTKDLSEIGLDRIERGDGKLGVVCAGGVYQYVKEVLPDASVYKAGCVYPLDVESIRAFAATVDELLIVEELEPIIEDTLKAAGITCHGKELFGRQGEFSTNLLKEKLCGFSAPVADADVPPRPPVMCAGCPHRGVFYVLNKLKLFVSGDIGCYSLGSAAPLSAIDAVMCMGASVGMAHGIEKARGREFSKRSVAVIGDSTFIHSGITGLVNAVYNQSNITLIILDNSTTGMTGHQQHAATGKNIRNDPAPKLDLFDLCRAIGVKSVCVVDAYDTIFFESVVKREMAKDCVSVIIAQRPCALLDKSEKTPCKISSRCEHCKMCLKIGCPAIIDRGDRVEIDASQCTGCGVCANLCKFGAIIKEETKRS